MNIYAITYRVMLKRGDTTSLRVIDIKGIDRNDAIRRLEEKEKAFFIAGYKSIKVYSIYLLRKDYKGEKYEII